MTDEDSDWISLDDAVSHVEATLHCYREKALDVVKQAADDLKLKTRTVTNRSPGFIESFVGGERIFHPYRGPTIEICRNDLLKLWPEHQEGETRNLRRDKTRRSRPNSDGINEAIDALWPQGTPRGLRAKDRYNQIEDWLERNQRSIPTKTALPRTVQRVLKERREREPS